MDVYIVVMEIGVFLVWMMRIVNVKKNIMTKIKRRKGMKVKEKAINKIKKYQKHICKGTCGHDYCIFYRGHIIALKGLFNIKLVQIMDKFEKRRKTTRRRIKR